MSDGRDRILVIDDSEQNRVLAQAFLTQAGYEVTQAESGEAAIAEFLKAPPELVLLDVLMPGMDGFETCARLRELPTGQDTPIIFVTALSDLGTHQKAMGSGADDFLNKPLNRTELLLRVRSLLRVKKLKSELQVNYRTIRGQRDQLLQVQRQKDELTALVVHDLKSPLSTVLALSRLLGRDAALAKDTKDSLELITSASENMARMVVNLLDISKSEDGQLKPRPEVIALPPLAQELVDAFRRRAAERELTLELKIDPSFEVFADRDLFRRVLENLLDNALRYAPRKSTVRIEAEAEGKFSAVRVCDEGKGVPDEVKDRIFDKYVQLGGPEDRARSSRGLGLAFCKLACEVHGGSIRVEPNEPKGSRFVVRLPAFGG
jgi:two-component system, sensor histidine kinase and response regulator